MSTDDARAAYTLIRDLPAEDRPRERLHQYGAAALNNAELIAILLRVGGSGESAIMQAQRLLREFGSLAAIHHAPFDELRNMKGIGAAKAAQVKAALELGIRLATAQASEDRAVVRTPNDVHGILGHEMSLLPQEEIRVVMLDARSRVIAIPTVYRGSVHEAHVRISELLTEPVKVRAAAIVLVHNHPSGDPSPSSQDGILTRQLYDAAKLMHIDLEDHVVIGGGRFASLRRLGLGFPSAGDANG
jgi:DNA repair protein RadC